MRGLLWQWLGGAVLVAGIALPACGKVESADVDATSDDGGDDDGGNPDAAGDEPDAAPGAAVGQIHIFSRNYTNELGVLILNSSATAAFGDSATEDCTVLLPGTECRVLECTAREPPTPRPAAGAIVIEGVNAEQAVLMPGEDGVYAQVDTNTVVLSDGGPVSALAAGGDIPAFEIADLIAPYSIGFQGGVPTSAGPVKVTASADYELFWGGIEPTDRVRISLAGPRSEGVRRLVDCDLAAGNGRVTFSSAALSLLPQGEIAFEARVETTTVETAGDYEVTFTAAVVARNGDDAGANWAEGRILLGP